MWHLAPDSLKEKEEVPFQSETGPRVRRLAWIAIAHEPNRDATFTLLWRSRPNNAAALGSHECMGWKRIEVGELIAIALAVRIRFVIVLLEPQKGISTTARQ